MITINFRRNRFIYLTINKDRIGMQVNKMGISSTNLLFTLSMVGRVETNVTYVACRKEYKLRKGTKLFKNNSTITAFNSVKQSLTEIPRGTINGRGILVRSLTWEPLIIKYQGENYINVQFFDKIAESLKKKNFPILVWVKESDLEYTGTYPQAAECDDQYAVNSKAAIR
ncbi:MAG: hypothetical protein JW841_02860 [Deltaproteobacteria bacterium]|nr:hypothetical protein [Deltaproteobacteria bacterium]